MIVLPKRSTSDDVNKLSASARPHAASQIRPKPELFGVFRTVIRLPLRLS